MNVVVQSLSVHIEGSTLLDAINLRADAGQWVTLIGPNGAGKSTLLRVIAGQQTAAGAVALDGTDPRRLNRRELARRVAVVPQQPVVPIGISVTDYVLLGRTPYIQYLGVESARDVAVVAETLHRLDLSSFSEREVSTLSGGEFQRTVLARALVQEAPVLLLDEPTAALDIGHEQRVMELVDQLRRERRLTVISAIHDLTVAGQFSDHVVLLSQGRQVAAGLPSEVMTEATIAEHYGASVRILHADDGSVAVVPARIWTPADRAVADAGQEPALPANPARPGGVSR